MTDYLEENSEKDKLLSLRDSLAIEFMKSMLTVQQPATINGWQARAQSTDLNTIPNYHKDIKLNLFDPYDKIRGTLKIKQSLLVGGTNSLIVDKYWYSATSYFQKVIDNYESNKNV